SGAGLGLAMRKSDAGADPVRPSRPAMSPIVTTLNRRAMGSRSCRSHANGKETGSTRYRTTVSPVDRDDGLIPLERRGIAALAGPHGHPPSRCAGRVLRWPNQ